LATLSCGPCTKGRAPWCIRRARHFARYLSLRWHDNNCRLARHGCTRHYFAGTARQRHTRPKCRGVNTELCWAGGSGRQYGRRLRGCRSPPCSRYLAARLSQGNAEARLPCFPHRRHESLPTQGRGHVPGQFFNPSCRLFFCVAPCECTRCQAARISLGTAHAVQHIAT